jgi:hypothetical protein
MAHGEAAGALFLFFSAFGFFFSRVDAGATPSSPAGSVSLYFYRAINGSQSFMLSGACRAHGNVGNGLGLCGRRFRRLRAKPSFHLFPCSRH